MNDNGGGAGLDELFPRIDHCGFCSAENPPHQEDDVCPECGATCMLVSTWGEGQADRYRTGERYDGRSELGRADLDGRIPEYELWLAEKARREGGKHE